MTINHKLRESIAVGLVIGILAFVAGAENYFSGIECQEYSASDYQNVNEGSITLQKAIKRTAFGDSTLAVRRLMK